MTALSEYERLETEGLWRETPDAQLRRVIVSVGDTTLVLTGNADTPLAHWSLPAIVRLNPGEHPAVFSPSADGDETLEIDEELVVTAIERVKRAIDRRRSQPGRLRLILTVASLTAVIALSVFWLPQALVGYAARITPEIKRAEIGESLLTQIRRVTGPVCSQPEANRALAQLAARLGIETERLIVVRSGVATTKHLPGGFILLNSSLVEDTEDPNVVAGYIIAEQQRAAQDDPLVALFSDAGVTSTARFLTSGQIPVEALTDYSETLLTLPMEEPHIEPLLDRFRAANIPATPYAYALDISGETTLHLIEADPVAMTAYVPILSDGEWVALQEICQG